MFEYEADVQKRIVKVLNQIGFTMFRNNVGAFQNKYGGWVRFGLCTGSSDLIGYRKLIITPEMVGNTIAQFAAIETKSPTKSRTTSSQSAFIHSVKNSGGVGIIASSIEDLKEYF